MVKSRDLVNPLNTDILDHKEVFSVCLSNHPSKTGPIDNWIEIYHFNTRLDTQPLKHNLFPRQ